MNRPPPVARITIVRHRHFLSIVVSDKGAREWIEIEGPTYGKLYTLDSIEFWLRVYSEMYEVGEVTEWLLAPE